MKSYEKYKPSGVEWIGDIPEGWEVKKLKYVARICNGQDYKDVEAFDGKYPVIGSGGEFSRAETFLYDKESVLLGRKGTINIPLYVNEPFWVVDTMYYTIISPIYNTKYIYYLTTTINFSLYQYGSAVPSMSQRDLKEIPFVFPDFSTQDLIANYLDNELTRIDTIIKTKEKLIDLLKEKRTSIISHAVTRGLDPNAKMKPSGVEWIGDIPEEWNILSIKYIFRLFAGGDIPEDGYSNEKDDEYRYPIYSNSLINNGLFGFTNIYRFENSTVTVTGRGDVGIAVPRFERYYPIVRLLVCVPAVKLDVRYFAYAINSSDKMGEQTAMAQLTTDKLGSKKVPFPHADIQTLIADYLDRETTQIDAAIEKTKQSIEKLKEYRTALIFACVTGKIDVREG